MYLPKLKFDGLEDIISSACIAWYQVKESGDRLAHFLIIQPYKNHEVLIGINSLVG